MAEFDLEAYERAVQRSLDDPIPSELRRQIADYIEPVTINRHLKHGDMMDLIGIVYPLIRDFLSQEVL